MTDSLTPKEVYQLLAELPSFKRASIYRSENGVASISLEVETKDHVRMEKHTLNQEIHLVRSASSKDAPFSVVKGTPVQLASDVAYQSVSPSGQRALTFRKSDKRYIEVRDRATGRLDHFIEVTDVHKDFITNEAFGHPVWNSDESVLAYVAECDVVRPETGDDKLLAKHRYTPSFGELMTSIRFPAIFLCDLSSGSSPHPYQLTDASHSSRTVVGQPCFVPAPKGAVQELRLVCTGYSSTIDRRRVGLIYCTNRPSSIYGISISRAAIRKTNDEKNKFARPKPIRLIADEEISARSPRCWEGTVVFLCNPVGGPHASCSALHRFALPDRFNGPVKTQAIVRIIDKPKLETRGVELDLTIARGFPGLYIGQLPASPFVSFRGRTYLVVDSIWRSWRRPLLVDLASGEIRRHFEFDEPGDDQSDTYSYNILGTDGKSLVAAWRSTTVRAPEIVIAEFKTDTDALSLANLNWTSIHAVSFPPQLQDAISACSTIVRHLTREDRGEAPCEAIITAEAPARDNAPLIVEPHGGPHSTSTVEFAPFALTMALLGYVHAALNYPGSLGFGQKWVTYLTQNLGKVDVESVQNAAVFLQDAYESKHVFVRGGSHGGFIAAHLTARWPKQFTAAVLRNPVTDLVGTASGGSDIPDWSFAEADLAYPLVGRAPPPSVDPAAYEILRQASPIASVSQVTVPTLMLLGKDDLRVSHQQGLAWAHALRGNGIEAPILLFDGESHPLSGVEASLASLLASYEHFEETMK